MWLSTKLDAFFVKHPIEEVYLEVALWALLIFIGLVTIFALWWGGYNLWSMWWYWNDRRKRHIEMEEEK